MFGRFEAAARNDRWTGDALHGPVITGAKSYLFAFVDDHSRLLTGYRWARAEDTLRLEAALRRGLAARGVPKQIYVDNGAAFVAAPLARACAVLGIQIVHSKPGEPAGRGKIERFFATRARPVPRRSRPAHHRRPGRTQRAVRRLGRAGLPPPGAPRDGALTSTVWAPLLAHLPGRSLYLVDPPGCGLADPFDYHGGDLASHQTAFVGSLLDALGLERAPLIGASMGGWFALRFAIERPDRVTAVALVTAPAVALPGALMPVPMALTSTWLGRRMGAMSPPPSARMMRRTLASIGGTDSVAEAPAPMFDALGAATALAAPSYATLDVCRWRTPHAHLQITEDELVACQTPMLLVWGEDDKVQSADAGAWAAHLLPHSRLEVLPGGHGLWFEHPQRCGQILSGFRT